ncbi:MAG TPA: DNA-binding response regulator, partial [Solibacterales bacterium]|nr:DNA-binding response regulator [Bryobacterales bacterium]
QMPEMDGFELLARLDLNACPLVVFVTAYDDYALKAFEFHAFDYLLKPFDRLRFDKTMERALARLQPAMAGQVDERLLALLTEMQTRRGDMERLAVKNGGRVMFVRTEEIDWIEAADNYVCLHVGTETHLLRETMNAIESRLDPKRFLRIHRSTIVNLDRIKELQPWFRGDYMVILRTGAKLTLSRSYRDKLKDILQA